MLITHPPHWTLASDGPWADTSTAPCDLFQKNDHTCKFNWPFILKSCSLFFSFFFGKQECTHVIFKHPVKTNTIIHNNKVMRRFQISISMTVNKN